MNTRPAFLPAQRRKLGKRKLQVAPPAPLVLVAAAYDAGTLVDLTFDRPIDVTALIPDAFIIFDGPSNLQYVGEGAPTVMSPTRFLLPLVEAGATGGAQVLLTVQTLNGIVAADGGTFPGLAGVVLPYP